MNRATRLVWDLPTRLTHWLLVPLISAGFVTAKLGSKAFRCHKYCGYAVLSLVLFRVVWGFAGTRYAKFVNFVHGPRALICYLRSDFKKTTAAAQSVGHNPLGGLSVLAMLAALLTQAGTGLFANDDVAIAGPLFGWVSKSLSDTLTLWHHVAFYALQVLVGLHIAAIAYYCCVKEHGLVSAMLSGRKSAALVSEAEEIRGSRRMLAAAIMTLILAAVATLLMLAPASSLLPL